MIYSIIDTVISCILYLYFRIYTFEYILSNPVRQANMGFSPLSLSQFLSSILFLFHFLHQITPLHLISVLLTKAFLCSNSKSPFPLVALLQGVVSIPRQSRGKRVQTAACDPETGHITALDLACSMLYGTLHPNSTLFSLHHLQNLDLNFFWSALQPDTS